MVQNLLANAGNVRDVGWIPGLGRSSEGGHGISESEEAERGQDRGWGD